jgi:hypothetical protein
MPKSNLRQTETSAQNDDLRGTGVSVKDIAKNLGALPIMGTKSRQQVLLEKKQ